MLAQQFVCQSLVVPNAMLSLESLSPIYTESSFAAPAFWNYEPNSGEAPGMGWAWRVEDVGSMG